MKTVILRAFLLVVALYALNSCSSEDSLPEEPTNTAITSANYTYNSSELEAMSLINSYRTSIGLSSLERINYISIKSEEHVNYMITNNVVNHDDFVNRSQDIINNLKAKSVSENVAYNYASPKAAVEAWLKSEGHKKNIEGNYTHFGISVKENPTNGKKYYTNIFVKI
jgi:uncharacterized protein YkwD